MNMLETFGESGPLARSLSGFRSRPQQQSMARSVETALAQYQKLVVEAGTGVGKTFAYLVPVLLSPHKVIVSTGTKHLQDQLYHQDLPLVRKALGVTLKTALLKGRANYLCLYRLENARQQGTESAQTQTLLKVSQWAGLTRTGDVAELSELPEDSPIWSRVTSTVDNCLGTECPMYQECHLIKARRAAQEADLVVINHHLFFADLAIREEGFGELLPSANAFILDEAHQLPELACSFFGTNLSARQIFELTRDTIAEQLHEAPELKELGALADKLNKAVLDLRLAMGAGEKRGSWSALRDQPQVAAVLDELHERLQSFNSGLESCAERGKGLQNCQRRATQLLACLKAMRDDPQDSVLWFETFRRSFILHNTPLNIADLFKAHTDRYRCAWILTSATLTVGENFDHFTTGLGLADAVCESLDSPYDYYNNALVYLPSGLPDPRNAAHTRAVVKFSIPVIEAVGGKTFMLFTSHRALREAAELLDGQFSYPMLVQGTAPRRELIERFRHAGNAVLLGTSSFWEGVDVRGPALSCVIIDKLPFASPDDPVLQARLDAIKTHGGNPFIEFQMPQAVLALKQGVGRLIRGESDTGVLMLCDPRLTSKPYGRVFLNSLPHMPITHDFEAVNSFIRAQEQGSAQVYPCHETAGH